MGLSIAGLAVAALVHPWNISSFPLVTQLAAIRVGAAIAGSGW